jgi:hypothetical protein
MAMMISACPFANEEATKQLFEPRAFSLTFHPFFIHYCQLNHYA